MKILLVNNAAPPTVGGVENSMKYIARELKGMGIETRMMCLQRNPNEDQRYECEGVTVHRLPYFPTRWPHLRLEQIARTTAKNGRRILDKFNPNQIWCRSIPMGIGLARLKYPIELSQIYSSNAYMHCRGSYLAKTGVSWSRRLLLLGLCPLEYYPMLRQGRELSKFSTTVAFSRTMLRELQRDRKGNYSNGRVIRPGVDFDNFSVEPRESEDEEVQEHLREVPGEKTLLYVGRLGANKNIPILIDAMRFLPGKVRLILVGNGNDAERLKRLTKGLGLSARVRFLGEQGALLPAFYRAADLMVLPTHLESFGQVILESLACGTPVIGFQSYKRKVITAVDEIVTDGVNGGLVEDSDSRSLSGKISLMLETLDKSTGNVREVCRESILRDYTWARFVRQMLI